MNLVSLLEAAVADGVFPGAAYAVGSRKGVEFGFTGRLTYAADSQMVGLETQWDLASLTKIVATTSCAMVLSQEGRLDLDAKVQSYVPDFSHGGITVRHLLTHTAGFAPSADFTDCLDGEAKLMSLPVNTAIPPKMCYSCLGFLVLQRVIEAIAGCGLDEFAQREVYEPLGMNHTGFRPSQTTNCAPTEEGTLPGIVHDPVARYFGGVGGNAGLFSTVGDLALWMKEMLWEHRVFRPEIVETWTTRQSDFSSRALGFDTRSPQGSSAGRSFSLASYGHTGFTGTSIWIDPVNEICACLLTNRVQPVAANVKITGFRPNFYNAVFRRQKSLEN